MAGRTCNRPFARTFEVNVVLVCDVEDRGAFGCVDSLSLAVLKDKSDFDPGSERVSRPSLGRGERSSLLLACLGLVDVLMSEKLRCADTGALAL